MNIPARRSLAEVKRRKRRGPAARAGPLIMAGQVLHIQLNWFHTRHGDNHYPQPPIHRVCLGERGEPPRACCRA
jgi:hypothetical protein